MDVSLPGEHLPEASEKPQSTIETQHQQQHVDTRNQAAAHKNTNQPLGAGDAAPNGRTQNLNRRLIATWWGHSQQESDAWSTWLWCQPANRGWERYFVISCFVAVQPRFLLISDRRGVRRAGELMLSQILYADGLSSGFDPHPNKINAAICCLHVIDREPQPKHCRPTIRDATLNNFSQQSIRTHNEDGGKGSPIKPNVQTSDSESQL